MLRTQCIMLRDKGGKKTPYNLFISYSVQVLFMDFVSNIYEVYFITLF